jgi:hypothetical protein
MVAISSKQNVLSLSNLSALSTSSLSFGVCARGERALPVDFSRALVTELTLSEINLSAQRKSFAIHSAAHSSSASG